MNLLWNINICFLNHQRRNSSHFICETKEEEEEKNTDSRHLIEFISGVLKCGKNLFEWNVQVAFIIHKSV